MKTNEIVLLVLCCIVAYLLISKDDESDVSGASESVAISELPDAEYRLDMPNVMYEVVIEDDEFNKAPEAKPRMKVVFRCEMVASSDMWIPAEASFTPGLKTGFQVIMYGPEGILPPEMQKGVRFTVETNGDQEARGIYLPAGKPIVVTVTVDQSFRVGLVGVRLHTSRVFCTDPRLPDGIEIPLVDAAFDTGLIDLREDEVVPTEPADQGKRS